MHRNQRGTLGQMYRFPWQILSPYHLDTGIMSSGSDFLSEGNSAVRHVGAVYVQEYRRLWLFSNLPDNLHICRGLGKKRYIFDHKRRNLFIIDDSRFVSYETLSDEWYTASGGPFHSTGHPRLQ